MAQHVRAALTHVKAQMERHFCLDVDQLAREAGHRWRQRALTPTKIVWFFALQILHGNCAINALRHLGNLPTQASSYCAARMKLPLALFTRIFDKVAQMAEAATRGEATLLNGRRVLLGDVSGFAMPDTIELRRHFGYPAGQREGCGFPVARLLGVIDALSGCVLTALCCPLFTHEAREMFALHPLLRKGDVLVADRGFCSYAQIALLMRHGVDTVMRLHQRRPTGTARDHVETWTLPARRPVWMSETMWLSLPQELPIRIVRYVVPRKGCRTRVVYVATTLLDPLAYPPETIMRLYGHRWNIETCFNQLKTHAKMNTLKSKTVEGVIKELMIYLIVWNLVRMTMLKFAQRAGVNMWRVSFIDTMRWLCALLQPGCVLTTRLLINPDRPGRWEPRKLKRRLKEYDLLKEPRQNLKAKHSARCG